MKLLLLSAEVGRIWLWRGAVEVAAAGKPETCGSSMVDFEWGCWDGDLGESERVLRDSICSSRC